MKIKKAMLIGEFGPRTEAQRVQAIKELKRWAQEVGSQTVAAKQARLHAYGLACLGNLNLRP